MYTITHTEKKGTESRGNLTIESLAMVVGPGVGERGSPSRAAGVQQAVALRARCARHAHTDLPLFFRSLSLPFINTNLCLSLFVTIVGRA